MHLLTFSLPVMWLIILVVLALAEAATINLVSIWFAAGALTALLVSLFCQNFWIQLVVFLLVSTLRASHRETPASATPCCSRRVFCCG